MLKAIIFAAALTSCGSPAPGQPAKTVLPDGSTCSEAFNVAICSDAYRLQTCDYPHTLPDGCMPPISNGAQTYSYYWCCP